MSTEKRPTFAAELAAELRIAMRETPRQMAAPFVAFWREVLKWGDPEQWTIKRE